MWAHARGCRRQRACPRSLARWCQENGLRVEAAGRHAALHGARLAGVPGCRGRPQPGMALPVLSV